MKSIKFVGGFALVVALAPFAAHADCGNAEAQIIAPIISSTSVDHRTCAVQVAHPSFFQSSGVCPLDIDEVIGNDIEVAKDDNGKCPAVGSLLNGILTQLPNGRLVLEQ